MVEVAGSYPPNFGVAASFKGGDDSVEDFVASKKTSDRPLKSLCEAVDEAFQKFLPVLRSETRLHLFRTASVLTEKGDGTAKIKVCIGNSVCLVIDGAKYDSSTNEIRALVQATSDTPLLSASNRWSVSAQGAYGKETRYEGAYDLSAPLSADTQKAFVYRIPLYNQEALVLHLTRNMPTCELQLTLRRVNGQEARLLSMRFVCWVVPNRHAMLFTPHWSFEDTPTVAPDIKPSPPATTMTSVNQERCLKYLTALINGDGFSLSVNRHGRRVISHRGSKECRFGAISELFLALSAIQHAAVTQPGQVEESLLSPSYLASLLDRSPPLKSVLEEVYKRIGAPLPSVYDLITGTSGLPLQSALEWPGYAKVFGDTEKEEQALGKLLGDSRPINDADTVELIRALYCRTVPFAPPDSVAQSSTLASQLLKYCNSSTKPEEFDAHMNESLFIPLGMTSTRYAKAEELVPSERPYRTSVGLMSTTDDLSTYLVHLCRNVENKNARINQSFLAMGAMPHVSVGQDRLEAVCKGAYEHMRIKLPLTQGLPNEDHHKYSVAVAYKFGEVNGDNCSLIVFAPALGSLQICLWMPISAAELFSRPKSSVPKAYQRQGLNKKKKNAEKEGAVGRFHIKKLIKHLIMSLIYSDKFGKPLATVDGALDMAFSGTPKTPTNMGVWKSSALFLRDEPAEGSYYHQILNEHKKGLVATPLVSLSTALAVLLGEKSKLLASRDNVTVLSRQLSEALARGKKNISQVQLLRTDTDDFRPTEAGDRALELDFVLRDEQSGEEYALAWDSHAVSPFEGKQKGAFRLIANSHEQSAGECVFIRLIHDPTCALKKDETSPECNTISLLYNGDAFVSMEYIREVIASIAEEISGNAELLKKKAERAQSSQHMPWLAKQEEEGEEEGQGQGLVSVKLKTSFARLVYSLSSDTASEREPIGRLGWIAPAVAGLGIGALAATAAVASAPYYYPPPPPPVYPVYPYGYYGGRPYYGRKRWRRGRW
jgi:hypothetical protein